MKKVLILGGNSDIGIKVAEKLVNDKNLILSIHYNKSVPKINKRKNVRLIKKNLISINQKNVSKFFKNVRDVNYDQSFLSKSWSHSIKVVLRSSYRIFQSFNHYRYINLIKINPDLKKKYIYFALHFQPERSTVPEGGIFGQ